METLEAELLALRGKVQARLVDLFAGNGSRQPIEHAVSMLMAYTDLKVDIASNHAHASQPCRAKITVGDAVRVKDALAGRVEAGFQLHPGIEGRLMSAFVQVNAAADVGLSRAMHDAREAGLVAARRTFSEICGREPTDEEMEQLERLS